MQQESASSKGDGIPRQSNPWAPQNWTACQCLKIQSRTLTSLERTEITAGYGSLLGRMTSGSIGRPMQPEGIYEDGLLMGKVLQVLLDDLWPNTKYVVALPVSDEMQEVHCLDHIISADTCLLRYFSD